MRNIYDNELQFDNKQEYLKAKEALTQIHATQGICKIIHKNDQQIKIQFIDETKPKAQLQNFIFYLNDPNFKILNDDKKDIKNTIHVNQLLKYNKFKSNNQDQTIFNTYTIPLNESEEKAFYFENIIDPINNLQKDQNGQYVQIQPIDEWMDENYSTCILPDECEYDDDELVLQFTTYAWGDCLNLIESLFKKYNLKHLIFNYSLDVDDYYDTQYELTNIKGETHVSKESIPLYDEYHQP